MTRNSKTQTPALGRHLQTPRERALVAAVIKARNSTGLSQREFAKKLGRTNNFVQRIEAGAVPVTVLDLIDIAKAADIPPDELIRRVIRAR